MRSLLWVGDAECDSGFAECTHRTLEALKRTWKVHVLGLNYRGDGDHGYDYPMWPAWVPGGDLFGVRRLPWAIEKAQPDLIVFQNDPWNIPRYVMQVDSMQLAKRPVLVGAIAVDSLNCRGTMLNGLNKVIFWTKFAEHQARLGGMTVPSAIAPLGVDLDVFNPGDRLEARRWLGLGDVPDDAFIVTCVNRNQPRKRLDLTIQYFAEWTHRFDVRDAYLFLHVAPTGDQGVDVHQLGAYYGINTPSNRRLIVSEPETYQGVPKRAVALTMRASDLCFTTPLGEGWGLTPMEFMGCRIPCALPNHSAFAEWAATGAYLVDCSHDEVIVPMVNTVGRVMGRDAAVQALHDFYQDRDLREHYAKAGYDLVNSDCFRWSNIAHRFAQELEDLCPQEPSSTEPSNSPAS